MLITVLDYSREMKTYAGEPNAVMLLLKKPGTRHDSVLVTMDNTKPRTL